MLTVVQMFYNGGHETYNLAHAISFDTYNTELFFFKGACEGKCSPLKNKPWKFDQNH